MAGGTSRRRLVSVVAAAFLLPALLVGGVIWSNRRAINRTRALAAQLYSGQPMSEVVEAVEASDHDGVFLTDASRHPVHLEGGRRAKPSAVRAALDTTRTGKLSVMVVGFVFLRHFVNVRFEEDTVVEVSLSSLD